MTQNMRDVLEQARREPLRRLYDGKDDHPAPWPAPWQTLRALVRRKYLSWRPARNRHGQQMVVWEITQEGREALQPKPPKPGRDSPLLVSAGWPDYTHDPGRAMRNEPEAVKPELLDRDWNRQARLRHAEVEDRKRAAARIGRLRRAS